VSEGVNDGWDDALATGNGRQGALCRAAGDELLVAVSHERLFFPRRPPLDPPDTARILPELRRLLAAGRYASAADAVCASAAAEDPAYAETVWIDPLIGAAVLRIRPGGPARTSVDLASGLVTLTTDRVRLEAFASRTEDAIVVRLTAPGGFAGTVELTPIDGPAPEGYRHEVAAGPDGLTLDGRFTHATWPGALTGYRVDCRVGGGELVGPGVLAVRGDALLVIRTTPMWSRGTGAASADAAAAQAPAASAPVAAAAPAQGVDLGVVVAGSGVQKAPPAQFRHRKSKIGGTGPLAGAARPAGQAEPAGQAGSAEPDQPTGPDQPTEPSHPTGPPDFDAMLAAHTAQHAALLARVHLDLGAGPADRARPMTELPPGPALVERLFDAGRHVIVSSTGTLPPTLQGVWSASWEPPWCSGYTVDGNLPAAVAALLPTRTPELLLPLFDLIDGIRDDLRRNARRLYCARGVLVPAHLSTHGRLNHFGPVWCQTFWTAGAGWLARLYVDYWRYTGDRTFLRERAWPFLYEAAAFLLDFVPVVDGVAWFAPSYSPENAPASTGSQATVNATMDVAVARDLLGNVLTVAAELGLAPPGGTAELLGALPAYAIENGRLAEWVHPDLTDQPAHRHASHLWPLWYEPDPLVVGDPARHAAAVAAVRDRLAWWESAESDEMGYGLAQLGLAAAALGLADEAWTCLRRMATRYWGANLVPRHNRGALFNVDIAGGFPAVVAAMLVRSAHGRLDLLPARPDAWPRGRVTGLAARDAVTVDELWWEPGRAGVTLSGDARLTVAPPPGMTFADGATSWTGSLQIGTALTLSCVSIKNISS
jgi:alpha-L-fucosidase 2